MARFGRSYPIKAHFGPPPFLVPLTPASSDLSLTVETAITEVLTPVTDFIGIYDTVFDTINLTADNTLSMSDSVDSPVNYAEELTHNIGLSDGIDEDAIILQSPEHALALYDTISAQTIFAVSVTDTLTLVHIGDSGFVEIVTDTMSMTDTGSPVLVYAESVSSSIGVSDSIDVVVNNAVGTSTLTLSDIVAPNVYYTFGVTDSISFTLSQYIETIVVLQLSADNTISVSDGVGYGDGLFAVTNLTLSDSATIVREYALSLNSTLALTDTVAPETVYNLDPSNNVDLTNDLDVTDAAGATVVSRTINNNDLTLYDTVSVLQILGQTLVDTLALVDAQSSYTIMPESIVLEDGELQLFDSVADIEVIDLLICDSLEIWDELHNAIELSASNDLTLSIVEGVGVETTLTLTDSVTTNMDNETCVRPGGQAPDAGLQDTMTLTDTIICNGVYNSSQTSGLSLLNTVAWRI